MQVFISSSSGLSKDVALLLSRRIAALYPQISVFTPPHDTHIATDWSQSIKDNILKSGLAVICLTRESLHSVWVSDEVGFIETRSIPIFTFLVDFPVFELSGPLSHYVAVEPNPFSLSRLASYIGDLAGDPKHYRVELDRWAYDLSGEISKLTTHANKAPPAAGSELWLTLIKDAAHAFDILALRELGAQLRERHTVVPDEFTRALLDAQYAVRDFDGFKETVQRAPQGIQNDVGIRKRYAQALLRLGKPGEALKILQEVEARSGMSSDLLGMVARTYKQLWIESRRQENLPLAQEYLEKSAMAYAAGFEHDKSDYSLGSNAVALLHLVGGDKGLHIRDRILPSLEEAIARDIAEHGRDYWNTSSQLELAVIKGDQRRAEELASHLLTKEDRKLSLATTSSQLKLLFGGLDKSEWAAEIARKLDEASA